MPDLTAAPDHPPEDPNGKAGVSGYQADYLREVGLAVAAGFEPQDVDPVNLPEEEWPGVWEEALRAVQAPSAGILSNTSDMRSAWKPHCTARRGTMVAAYRALDRVLAKWGYRPRSGVTGSFNCRPITGGTNYSLHAYLDGEIFTFWTGVRVTTAVAVDVNWDKNPYGPRLITDMPRGMIDEIVALRTGNGKRVWGWGGFYSGNKDAMHFELWCTAADLRTGVRAPDPVTPIDPTPKLTEEDLMPQVVPSAIIPPDGLPHPFAVGLVEVAPWGPCYVSIEQDLMGADPGLARVAVGSEVGGFHVVEVPGKSGRQYVMQVPKGNDKAGSVVNRTGAELVVMVEHHPPAK